MPRLQQSLDLRRVLVQLYGFQATFIITAGMKLLGWVPLLPVPWLLEDSCRCSRRTAPADQQRQPLLDAEQTQAAALEAAPLVTATTVPGQIVAAVADQVEGRQQGHARTHSAA